MSSLSSHAICENGSEEIDTFSVYHCVFCNLLLNGQAVILDCLHVTCRNCLENKKSDSGLQCKCLAVTNSFNNEYPIVSSSISKTKICDICNLEANKNCVYCKTFYCKQCSKVHLASREGRSHNPDLVMSYPLKSDFILCPKCCKKGAEVFCTECSVSICSLCHLNFHRNHNFKVLNVYCEKIKKSLAEKNLKLRKDYEHVEYAVGNILKESQKLKIQKNSIFDEIDKVMKKLHDELDKRVFELKENVEYIFGDSIDQINKNRVILIDILNKNKYYINLVDTVLKHEKADDIATLSGVILKKLGEPCPLISLSAEVSRLNFDVKFISDESLENCISAIKNIGYIIERPNNNSQDFISLQTSNLNDNVQEGNIEAILSSSIDSDADSGTSNYTDYEPLVDCSCCNQWATKLIKCSSCSRNFHHDCHIPTLPQDMYKNDPPQTMWKCTLCQDITRYVKVLNQRDFNGVIPVSKTELVIMERILMEIYCQNIDSEHYRKLPNKEIYPAYYQKVNNPLSLNNIKQILESNQSYSSLINFLKDLRYVFSIGIFYYSPCDPYYKSAVNLQLTLEKLINRWIPKLKDDNRLY